MPALFIWRKERPLINNTHKTSFQLRFLQATMHCAFHLIIPYLKPACKVSQGIIPNQGPEAPYRPVSSRNNKACQNFCLEEIQVITALQTWIKIGFNCWWWPGCHLWPQKYQEDIFVVRFKSIQAHSRHPNVTWFAFLSLTFLQRVLPSKYTITWVFSPIGRNINIKGWVQM